MLKYVQRTYDADLRQVQEVSSGGSLADVRIWSRDVAAAGCSITWTFQNPGFFYDRTARDAALDVLAEWYQATIGNNEHDEQWVADVTRLKDAHSIENILLPHPLPEGKIHELAGETPVRVSLRRRTEGANIGFASLPGGMSVDYTFLTDRMASFPKITAYMSPDFDLDRMAELISSTNGWISMEDEWRLMLTKIAEEFFVPTTA